MRMLLSGWHWTAGSVIAGSGTLSADPDAATHCLRVRGDHARRIPVSTHTACRGMGLRRCDVRKKGRPPASVKIRLSAPGQIRTADTRFRRAVLYPLSYGGTSARAHERRHPNGSAQAVRTDKSAASRCAASTRNC